MSVPPENVMVDGTVSIASYKPKTEMDYGTMLCWGDNELGRQSVPCVFHIIPAGVYTRAHRRPNFAGWAMGIVSASILIAITIGEPSG
jgi:hypothetical protein